MISRIKGRLDSITENKAFLDVGGICYEILITKAVGERLTRSGEIDSEVSFHTMHYIEGTVGMGNLIPRLVGFLNESDLEFFSKLITVQGLSVKRSLKALALPVKDVAKAIELNDTVTLKKLPEIGGKLAQKIIVELKGKVAKFALLKEDQLPHEGISLSPGEEYQQEAVEVLIQLQYSRTEAEMIVAKTAEMHAEITSSEALIQEIFRSQI